MGMGAGSGGSHQWSSWPSARTIDDYIQRLNFIISNENLIAMVNNSQIDQFKNHNQTHYAAQQKVISEKIVAETRRHPRLTQSKVQETEFPAGVLEGQSPSTFKSVAFVMTNAI
jgi:hypothetical protein